MNIIWRRTLKAYLYIWGIIIVASFFINLLYYYDIIDNTVVKLMKLVIVNVASFIGGYYQGKGSPNKGYLYGLRLSLFVILTFILFGIIFNNIKLTRIIFYLIITCCITFGAMLGINKKD